MKWFSVVMAMCGLMIPFVSFAQDGSGLADNINSLHSVLDQLYNQLMPLCSSLTSVGRAIAGFGCLWYIAYRVWGHLSRNEPIDFFPLFRPFCIGFIIANFKLFILMVNGIMHPTVSATAALVKNTDAAVATLLQEKAAAVQQTSTYQMFVGATGDGDREKWYQYTHDGQTSSDEGWFASIGNDVRFALAKASYNFRNAIKEVIAEVLQLIFAAVSLCINTLRTFNLIILAIIGPFAFALGVFDGFHHTIRHWVARYINIFLWLPVANIFGFVIASIQVQMLKLDLSQIASTGDTFFSRTDMGYLVFLIIGIIGYTTVPSIANQIIHVGGGGDALTGKVTGAAGMAAAGAAVAAGGAVSAAAWTAGRMEDGRNNLLNMGRDISKGYNESPTGKGMAADAGRLVGSMTAKKITGDSS